MSVIDYEYCKQNNWTNDIRKTKFKLSGATNFPLQVIGQIKLRIRFPNNSENSSHTFIIVENLGNKILLGIDFLLKYKLVLDPSRQVMYNSKVNLKLFNLNKVNTNKIDSYISKAKQKEKFNGTILAKEEINLKANTEHILNINIITDENNIGKEALLETHNRFKSIHEDVLIGASLNKVENKLTIKAINLSDNEKSIQKNTPILHLTPLTDILVGENTDNNNTHSSKANEHKIFTINNELEFLNKIDIGKLSNEEKQKVIELLRNYPHVFSQGPTDLGFTDKIVHKIETTNDKPVNKKSYRMEHSKREALEKEVKDLMDARVIQHSTSLYNAPVLLVRKKDGSFRLVIDYRALNSVTKDENWPLPNINDIFDSLKGNTYFSSLDLKSGYFQCAIRESDQCKTAFEANGKKYEFTRVPMGLKSSPVTFSKLMSLILSEKKLPTAWIYLDDILCVNKTFDDHLNNLKEVFQLFEKNNLKLQPAKCHLFQEEVVFLGHKLTREGVVPNKSLIEAVKNYGRPKNAKNVKQYLGLINFYRRFIPNLAKISVPLVNLTRKNQKFKWSSEEEKAFQHLKCCLLKSPVLIYPDLQKDFVIHADASDFAIGAVLGQLDDNNDMQAIAYMSRKLNDVESRYSTTDRELLSIVYAVKQFHPYIYGRKTKLYTDHKSLLYLQNLSNPSDRHLRYILKLQTYNLELIHKPGKANLCADALSRDPNFERKTMFKNKTVNFLKILQPNYDDLKSWKEKICAEMSITSDLNNKVDESESVICSSNKSGSKDFFGSIALWLTGSIKNHQAIRNLLHKHITQNRSVFRDKYLDNNITDTRHLNILKNGGKATKSEIYALSAILRIPISFESNGKEEILMGTTESGLRTAPPNNLSLGLKELKDGNFEILWPNEKSLSINVVTENNLVEKIPNKEEIKILQSRDQYCRKWINFIKNKITPDFARKHFDIHKDNIRLNNEGILLYKPRTSLRQNRARATERIVLPESMISLALRLGHDNKASAHPGRSKTWEIISHKFFRPGLNKIVHDYVKDCVKCMSKTQTPKLKNVKVKEMPTANAPFQIIYSDIVGPLVMSENKNKYILVLIDSFSKWVEAYPLKTIDSVSIGKVIVSEFFPRYGIPDRFHTDNAANLNSEVMKDIFDRLGITKTKTTSFHPAGNGACERANKSIVDS